MSEHNQPLWAHVQRLVYPDRWPSEHRPFPAASCTPKRKPASWLYHKLAADTALRAQVLP